MKTFFYTAASVILLTSSAFVLKTIPSWKITEKYSVKFSAGEAEGIFKGLKGTIKFDAADLAGSSMDMSIDVNTINTGNGMMNKHAKGKEWLDATAHPSIRFVSSSFSKSDNGFVAKGKLTLKGTTKDISIPFTFAANTFKGSFSLARKDYKITEDGIDDNIKITLDIPVKK